MVNVFDHIPAYNFVCTFFDEKGERTKERPVPASRTILFVSLFCAPAGGIGHCTDRQWYPLGVNPCEAKFVFVHFQYQLNMK